MRESAMTGTARDVEPTASEYVAYDYLNVRAERELEPLYKDTYRSFGWTIEGYGASSPGTGTLTLKLKRDRRIKSRPLVTELQRKAEGALSEIASLERSKSTNPLVLALTIGIVGSAFLAGSVFAITESDHWGLSIPLGAIGLLAWLAGFLSYGRVRARKTAQLTPVIDRQYDIVYETAEHAAQLLA